jgi:ribonuclease R
MTKKFSGYIYLSSKGQDLENDQIVEVELTEYPNERKAARGKIIKVLGHLTDPRIEDEIVINRYNIIRDYPESAENYVKETSEKYMENPGKRTDFRELTTVTIDGETAKDFDDAISLEVTDKEYILYVHIADVSHFVRPGSPVDMEAYKRGTSFYFPEFAIPMLPESLSNNLCSLMPNQDRLAMTAKITYFKNGNRKKSHMYRSAINSDRRLTYKYVQDVLDGNIEEKDQSILKLIKDSEDLSKRIMKRRYKDGMLDFDFPEAVFEIAENGDVKDILAADRDVSNRIIEHFMIEANEAVSEFLENNTKKSIYRIHDKPDPQKLGDFSALAETFGVMIDIKDITPKEVSIANQTVNESEYHEILGSALVRTMAKAEYNTNNIGHFGLASKSYTHFTSPIRRYPDLIVHRLLSNKLFNAEYNMETTLEDACKLCTENEQRAENAERDIHKFKKIRYLQLHREEPFEAIVTNVGAFGLAVYIEKLMLKGTVPLEFIQGDVYQFIKKAQIIKGKRTGTTYRASDVIEVMTERIDIDFQEVYFYTV